MKRCYSFLYIFLFVLLFYSPIIFKPELLFERGNDLQEQFFPVFNFIRQEFLIHHNIPFWNPTIFAGIPLLPDPQFSLFYPFNILFLIFTTSTAFLIWFILHSFLGGIGFYFLIKKIFHFSPKVALFTSLLYIATPKVAGYLEAGHYGLVGNFAWFPFLIMSLFMIAKKPAFGWSIVLGISLAGLFFTHTITFGIALFSSILLIINIVLFFKTTKTNIVKSFSFFIFGIVLSLGLSAITLFPQLEWMPDTTRFLLLNTKDVYPQWHSFKEFLLSIFWPWSNATIDTEKWLTIGILPLIFASIGFLKAERKVKIILLSTVIAVAFISINNLSPFYSLLLKQNLYILSRVTTRVWFLSVLLIIILCGYGAEKLIKQNKKLVVFLALIAISEILLISWKRIMLPVKNDRQLAPDAVYRFLKEDHDVFRVFCTTRCLSRQKVVYYNLETIEGYNTLQQENFYKESWQLMGGYWNYYTLALPPIGFYKFSQLKPDPKSLGKFNTKYVVSPYELSDNNFELNKKIDSYFIYYNKLYQHRAYFLSDKKANIEAKVLTNTPDNIRIDTSIEPRGNKLLLSQIWSNGWKAYLNGSKETIVQQTPDTLQMVDITKDTRFVDFKYEPDSFLLGRKITIATVLLIIFFGIYKWQKTKKLF